MNLSFSSSILKNLGLSAAMPGIPDEGILKTALRDAIKAMPNSKARELDPSSGKPGGLLRIKTDLVAIIPDLHARYSLPLDFLGSTLPQQGFAHLSLFDVLESGRLSVVCLGDLSHSEGAAAAEIWRRSTLRFLANPKPESLLSDDLDLEMTASLKTLHIVATLMAAFPDSFHCLKGNHDNLTNRDSDGDHPFMKYALEGELGAAWLRMRYSREFLSLLREFELLLPLVAAGKYYCASHAAPGRVQSVYDLARYRDSPETVESLIWTADGKSSPAMILPSMAAILGEKNATKARWISGHRPIGSFYKLQEDDLLVKIHNPTSRQVALIEEDKFEPSIRIFSVQEASRPLEWGAVIPPRGA